MELLDRQLLSVIRLTPSKNVGHNMTVEENQDEFDKDTVQCMRCHLRVTSTSYEKYLI